MDTLEAIYQRRAVKHYNPGHEFADGDIIGMRWLRSRCHCFSTITTDAREMRNAKVHQIQ